MNRAQKRIQHLLNQAAAIVSDRPRLADRYAELAWKIKLKANTPLTKQQKLHICRQCQSYLAAGDQTIRLKNGVMTRTCPTCNNHARITYSTD